MPGKCLLTGEYCKAVDAGFWDYGDSCPIRRYKNSTRQEEDALYINDTCRYYGIARAKELQRKYFREDL